MTEHVTVRGGVRLDALNATWPLATLTATRTQIEISVPLAKIFGQTHFVFPAERVRSLERYVVIPILGWGVRIHHNIVQYPSKVVFWTFSSPNKLLASIANTGFKPWPNPSLQRTGSPSAHCASAHLPSQRCAQLGAAELQR